MVRPSDADGKTPRRRQKTGKGEQTERGPSQATKLVALLDKARVHLFHDHAGVGYATFTMEDHRETWPLKSKGFSNYARRMFWEKHGTALTDQAYAEALGVLTGKANFDGPEERVALRRAGDDEKIYLDLCDANWHIIEISADGWRLLDDSPMRFVRRNGMLALPKPFRNGDLNELRRFINVGTDREWLLILAWLVQALRPTGPYPLLALNGEQGSAKSTACRILRMLIDPNESPLRRPPRDERDLMIAAKNSALLVFENLSSIPAWLSDGLCSLATGGGFATRELYTDDEEALFNAQRPIIINGIGELATRSDLLDRTIGLHLPAIPDENRVEEAVLLADFEKARPRILGGLLDAVSTALRNLPNVKLDGLPRMADFAKWVSAAEEAFGCEAGAFLNAYVGNREQLNEQAIDDAPIGRPVLALMEGRELWSGSATELLKELEMITDEAVRKEQGWPKRGNALSGALKRIAPNLRRLGVDVEFGRKGDRGRGRLITIRKGAQNTVRDRPTVQTSGDDGRAPEAGSSGDSPDSREDSPPSAADLGNNGSPQTISDDVDDLDDEFVNPPGGVQHKRTGCPGQSVWEHVNGGLYCAECWPPTDKAAIRKMFSDS